MLNTPSSIKKHAKNNQNIIFRFYGQWHFTIPNLNHDTKNVIKRYRIDRKYTILIKILIYYFFFQVLIRRIPFYLSLNHVLTLI